MSNWNKVKEAIKKFVLLISDQIVKERVQNWLKVTEIDNNLTGILETVVDGTPISNVYKIGIYIQSIHLQRQTNAFIIAFNNGALFDEELEQHKEYLEVNPEQAQKEIERVMIFTNMHTEEKQSEVLGHLYRSYVNKKISWEEFCELSEANRRMFIYDYQILESCFPTGKIHIEGEELRKADRLMSLGLIENSSRYGGGFYHDANKNGINISLTQIGMKLCEIIKRH